MVDANAQIDSVERGLRTDDIDGVESHVQTLTQTYPAPIADVWDAVTSAERIPRWFLPVSGDLRLGGRYQLEGNAGGEIQTCEPPKEGAARLGVTWEYGGGLTWLTVQLIAADGERTRLELEHVAHTADVPEGVWAQFGPSATGIGWDGTLLGLAQHIGDGDLTPENSEAWTMSPEGMQFMRGSADAWADVHKAAGADAETAASAAEATYLMYTGQGPDQTEG